VSGDSPQVPLKDSFTLTRDEARRLYARALAAQKKDQSEVCGLVFVACDGSLRLGFMPNRATQVGSYALDPSEISKLEVGLTNDETILGTFHSHPISEAVPSKGDIERGFLHGHELICDVCGLLVRLWRKVDDRVEEVPLRGTTDLEIFETEEQALELLEKAISESGEAS
jgi:proteasome lid subunit RPN8/RPN11